jgi:hypothetical protein
LGAVPTEFDPLVQNTDLSPELHEAIAHLLIEKRSGDELRIGKRIPVLSDFIDAELHRFEQTGATRQKPETDMNALNQLFQQVLQEVWV